MPIIKAAKKALRASKKRHEVNSKIKKHLKDTIKKTSEKNINITFSLIDKAAKKNLIHPNKAARLKSRLAKKIKSTPKSEKAKSETKKPVKKVTKITKK